MRTIIAVLVMGMLVALEPSSATNGDGDCLMCWLIG